MRFSLGVIAIAFTAVAGRPLVAQEVPAWAQEAEEQWFAAIEAGEVSTLQRSLTEDAAIMFPAKTVRGREKLDGFLEALFMAGQVKSCEWQIEDVEEVDRTVVVVTRSRCQVEVRQGNRGDTESRYRVIKVYERQADDMWLIVRIDAQPED